MPQPEPLDQGHGYESAFPNAAPLQRPWGGGAFEPWLSRGAGHRLRVCQKFEVN
jgi:hypothetical protein